MKVLIVASKYPPEYAGAGYRIHASYKRLEKLHPDLEWSVICTSVENRTTEHYQYDGVDVKRIGAGKRCFVSNFGFLHRFVDTLVAYRQAFLGLYHLDKNVDVVHVFGSSGLTAITIMWAKFRRIPLLIELVTKGASPQQTLPGIAYFWKPSATGHVAVIAISEFLADISRKNGFSGKIWSRPNPVNEIFFYPDIERRTALRKELTPFLENDIVLVAVAKFMPQKNQLFLIDVLAKLPNKYKLVLAGPVIKSGPLYERDQQYMHEILQRIEFHGLANRVYIKKGFVEMSYYVKLANIFLLPNKKEGLGTPMLESLACAVPVVANRDESAFQQWINDGEDGLLVELDVDKWVTAIEKVVLFDINILKESSKRILESAGTSVIDEAFWKLLVKVSTASNCDEFQFPEDFHNG